MLRFFKMIRILPVIALLAGVWFFQVTGVWLEHLGIRIGSGALFSIMVYVGLVETSSLCKRTWNNINHFLENTDPEVLLGSIAGLLFGLLAGFLIGFPFSSVSGVGLYVILWAFLVCGYLGFKIGKKRGAEMIAVFSRGRSGLTQAHISEGRKSDIKVLDTSAIIDGRIYDVCLANFMDGRLVVPSFVLQELRHIADSSDYIRRNKGRRGLEILAKMQKSPKINIEIVEGDHIDEKEVDNKLIRLCKELNASIVTNDYNLNKVAELQGIRVLNVNELTNAVKVIVFPGETIKVHIIKAGKEDGQGVGYLEDGTMVVVENGADDIGNEVEVMVTSVFQTSAGRMIFSKKTKENLGVKTAHQVQRLQEVNFFG
ncbi:MAG TPA: TRAM domain-containing protein [Syntrophothermus lipocalidus]|uniref:PilT protein domain protein n=1 Tax=Syntrophothermus lipocalidus (strain DSM 12680 / TGB-C1) TaxID=643648 RepID=D7CJQ0_SYNLT|nr:PIN domain-containing protein [Syntrophothermus lipocalidus]ADI03005.1 PilT protein domain protein [Syntrophothermus lipocalidus DSM 12680]HHV76304.1 TRAM domain-containing protein [Syntrophothermus lipocalidus]